MSGNYTQLMERIHSEEHFVFGAALDRIVLHNANSTLKLRFLPERLLLLPVSLYVRKDSCLIDVFEEKILQFSSNGFLSMWRRKFKPTQLTDLDDDGDDDHDDDNRIVIGRFKMIQLVGAFQILFVLHASAVFVLAIELASTKWKWLKVMVDN